VRKAIIISAVVLWSAAALVIVFFLITGVKGDDKMFGFGGDVILLREESISLGTVNTLITETTYQRIGVTLHDGDDCTVRHYDYSKATPFTFVPHGHTLEIRLADRKIVGGFGFSADPRLEISIPRKYAESVDLTSVSGSVRIEGDVSWYGAALKTTSGSISIGQLEAAGNVSVNSTSGSVRAGGIKGSEITVKTTSGSLNLGTVEAAGAVSLTSVSGSVRADSVTAESHQIKTTSGSIHIGEIDRNKGEIRSTSGSIRTG
jgi:hypothetical protein